MNERSSESVPTRYFTQRLLIAGVGLAVLFTVLSPDASKPLTLLPRFCFWSLHIGLGLALAELAARCLIQRIPACRNWRLVVWSGLAGVTLFAPVAYGLEALFPLTAAEPDGDWTDRFAQSSLFAAILIELIEVAPSYLVAWLLINREGLTRRLPVPGAHSESVALSSFLDRLPPAVGRQVIAVSSDLHYLQVTTARGSAMILGSLKEVESAFGGHGLRVHRSHWVALDAVRRVRKGGGTWKIELVGGQHVPISRRKRTAVVAQLGEDFLRDPQQRKHTHGAT